MANATLTIRNVDLALLQEQHTTLGRMLDRARSPVNDPLTREERDALEGIESMLSAALTDD